MSSFVWRPKKPNSAKRKIVKVIIDKYKRKRVRLFSRVQGYNHCLRKNSKVLIRGGGAKDLPYVNYTCIPGKYDFIGLKDKKRRRSIYGASRGYSVKLGIRKKRRNSV